MSFVAPPPPTDKVDLVDKIVNPQEEWEEPKVEDTDCNSEFEVGDPVFYYLQRGEVLEKSFAILTRRLPYHKDIPGSGKWQLTVLSAPGAWMGMGAGVPFSKTPKSGHWSIE